AEITHLIGIERGLCAGKAVRQIDRAPRALGWRIVFGQHEQHSGSALSVPHVHGNDAPLGDRSGNDDAISGATLPGVFKSIGGSPGHLQSSIDAIERESNRVAEIAFGHGPFSSDDAGRIGQRGAQGPAGERNLEIVMAIPASIPECSAPSSVKGRTRHGGADERRLGLRRSPWLVGDASESDTRGTHPVVFVRNNYRNRNERERERSAIAHFAIELLTG